ncbi:MAG: GGDEF domain-containing protein [Fervidobacterium sp.]|uniref:GGDEF domain-containing protein n=1 Tax=Fervidobacterium sp. TaxID=1871331 RepID=UPI00404B4814
MRIVESLGIKEASETSLLTLSIIDFINTLDEWEFVDKLCRAIFVNTNLTSVRVMTRNCIKIIGKARGEQLNFDSENIKIHVYYDAENRQDLSFVNSISIIAELHLRNIYKHTEITKLAFYDELTGAYTRTAGLKFLESACESVKRSGRKAYLVFIDLDNLKTFNDTYGHKVGDEILRGFAQACLNNMRRNDLLVRYGGDEFLLFIDSDRPDVLIERVIHSSPVTFSFGITEIDNKSLDELIRSADEKMYEMKYQRKEKASKQV